VVLPEVALPLVLVPEPLAPELAPLDDGTPSVVVVPPQRARDRARRETRGSQDRFFMTWSFDEGKGRQSEGVQISEQGSAIGRVDVETEGVPLHGSGAV
jgi:hypothetical protein